MELPLSAEQRKEITINELAGLIFRIIKERGSDPTVRPPIYPVHPASLLNQFYNEPPGPLMTKPQEQVRDEGFFLKFSEAMALLKRRGLLVDKIEDRDNPYPAYIYLTSVGERSSLDDYGMLILIDGAQEIVDSLKEQIPNLDPVLEQYYLESLRACQEGLYISSVICLGAASERTIDCLKEAIVRRYPQHKKLEKKWVSDTIKYILINFGEIFGPVIDSQLRVDLKEQLDLMEKIYRLNRSEAGHPKSAPMSMTRCEQENYLNAFRRYAITVFRVIDALNSTP